MKITTYYDGPFKRVLGDKRFRINTCACNNHKWRAEGDEPMFREKTRGFTIKLFKHGITFDFGRCKGCDTPF